MKKITKPKKQEQPLEEEILKKVYKYEAQRTHKMILSLFLGFMFVQFFIVLTASVLYQTLKEQETLDLLQLFGEDMDIIREYFGDVVYAFWIESPQGLLLTFLILLLTIFGIIFFVVKNYRKIKNRLASINTFFSKK
jgi:hypothetical protein